MTKSPTVRQRRLGRELRRLREQAELTPEAAARPLGWSRSKLNRVENARIAVTPSDVANACDLYRADFATKTELIQLCKDAAVRGWWTAYSDVFTGYYIALETEATIIRKWEPILIPGLLQSEEYAYEVIGTARPELTKSQLDRHVGARMTRKINLLRPGAPTLHALIDEAALRRPVGSPGLMARQLNDILQVSDWPNITIQVLPTTVGAHSGMEGAFSILGFGDEDPEVGYIECSSGDVYVEAADQLLRLTLMFERLRDICLSPKKSAALIAAVRSSHDLP